MCKGKRGARPGLTGLLLVSVLLCACGGGGSESSSPTSQASSTVNGTAQKGPYPSGTPVTIYKLDSRGNRTGKRVTTTVNAFGNFFAKLPWDGPSEAEINGNYYDELNAVYSASPQRLNALFEATDTQRININLFTSLASARARTLTASGQDFSAAIAQARNDIVSTFQLKLAAPGTLTSLDLTNGSGQDAEDNANLLLFSAAILSAGIDSQALSDIESDFADDGQVNSAGLALWINLCAMATTFSLDNVTLNIENLAWVQDAPDFSDLNFTYPAWVGVGNDRDADGLDDHEEVLIYLSDPLDSDTDDDTYSDSQEIALGGDPLNASSLPLAFTSAPGVNVDATRDYTYGASTTWPSANYVLASGPAGMSVDPVSGLVSWTPGLAQTGIYNVVLDASDQGYTLSQSFTINVAVFNTGDINEDSVIDARDWLLAQRISLGLMAPTVDQLNRGDIKLDGQVSGADVLLIERLALGL